MQQTAVGRQWALVLAGGDGNRLQALTRKITGTSIPKQYCHIVGDRSLLEHQPWPATYRVTSPARIFRLDAAGLAKALQGNPDPRLFLDALRSRRHDHDVAAAVRKLVASPA